MLLLRLKPLLLRSTLFDPTLVLYRPGIHVLLESVTTSFKQLYAATQKKKKNYVQHTAACFTKFLAAQSITLQAQQEYPPNMQCKDKFMIQSTLVPPHSDVDELPPDTFNKDSGKMIEECKLRVVCINPASDQRNTGDFALHNSTYDPDTVSTLWRLKEERDAAAQQTVQLQQELDMLKRRRYRRSDPGFSFKFAIFVGIIGMLVGLLLNLSLSSP